MLHSSYAAKLSPLLDEYAAEGNVVPDEEIAGKIESIRMALGKGKVQVKDKDIHIKAVPWRLTDCLIV